MDHLYRWTHHWAADPRAVEAVGFFLVEVSWPWMLTLLALLALLWALRLPALVRLSREIPGGARLGFLAVFVLAVLLRLLWAPRMPQVYFDEFNFLEAARGMAEKGLYLANEADGTGRIVPVPPAWPALMALAFRAVAPGIDVAIDANLLLACLTMPVLFLVAWLLFGRPLPTVLATLFLAVLPIHLRMSGSMVLETGSLFFLLLTWLGLLMYRRERRVGWLYAAGLAGALCMNWRMENPLVLVPGTVLLFLVIDPERRRTLRNSHAWTALALAWLLALPSLVADLYGCSQDFYVFYATEEARSRAVRANLAGNLLYWVDGAIHPPYLTALALVGALTWRPRREAVGWLAWVGVLHVFYTLNPSADFGIRHTVDSWRVALHPDLGVILLAAAGTEDLWRRLSAALPRAAARGLAVALLLAVAATPLAYRGFVGARHVWMREYVFLEEAGQRLPEGAHLLVEGTWNVVGNAEMRRSMLAHAARRSARIQWFPEEAFRHPGEGPPPQGLVDLYTWTSVAGDRVFLYYVGKEGVARDEAMLAWLQEFMRLRMVAGIALPETGFTFTLFEVDGLSAEGLRWVGEGNKARRGPG